jgi:PAS domain S-box-containing protein
MEPVMEKVGLNLDGNPASRADGLKGGHAMPGRQTESGAGLLDCISDPVIALDRQWRIAYANPAGKQLLGGQPGSVEGASLWDLAVGLRGTPCETEFQRVMQERLEGRVEFTDGRSWFLVTIHPAPTGVVSLWRDITQRKSTEDELLEMTRQKREALALLDAIFDYAPIGLGFWDRDFRFVRLNRMLAEINGLPADAHLGRSLDEVLPDLENIREMLARWRDILATGRPILNVEVSGKTPASPEQKRYWLQNWYPVRVAGRTVGIAATVMDITRRKLTEQALRESEKRLRLATRASRLGVFEWDTESDSVVWENEQMFEIFGRTRRDGALNRLEFLKEAILPEDAPAFERELDEAMQRNEAFAAQCRIRRKDGAVRWIETCGLFEKASNGAPARLIGVLADISERKQAETDLVQARDVLEAAVKQRTARLDRAINALKKEIKKKSEAQRQLRMWSGVFMDSADPIIVEDFDGTIVEVNREAERAYGWTRDELIGRNAGMLHVQGRCALATALRNHVKEGEEVRNWEGFRKNKSGEIQPVLLTMFPLTTGCGKVSHLASIAKDITERNRMEKELRDSHQRLQDLSRMSVEAMESDRHAVARELHDGVGGSLAAVKFSLENTSAVLEKDPAAALASLQKVIPHLVNTIKETRRISTNLRPLILDELGLLQTIAWYFEQLAELYSETRFLTRLDIREKDIPGPLKIVIYRVLQEAVTNANKHGRPGVVQTRLGKEGGSIVLEVEDDGYGFDPQEVARSSGGLSGHGLLGMGQRVELCGGTFGVQSEPGKGTVVKAALPVRS